MRFEKRRVPIIIILVTGMISLLISLPFVSRVDAAKKDFLSTQKTFLLYQSEIWRVAKLDLSNLEAQLVQTELRFPSEDQFSVLIEELNGTAKGFNVSMISMSPRGKVESQEQGKEGLSQLDRIPMEMKLGGAYGDLALFLSSLSDLEHGILQVDQFQLAKAAEPKAGALNLVLTSEVFVKKEAEQDILAEAMNLQAPLPRQAPESRFDHVERDPFVRVEKITAKELKLEGIVYDPVDPMVLINGEVRRVGDQVDGMTITEIHQDKVLLDKGGKQVVIRLR